MQDPRFQGEIGHKLGEALLLRFLGPARPEPDLSIDALAVLQEKFWSDERMAGVVFHFQFKTGKLAVKTRTVMKWIELNNQVPIFLIQIKSSTTEHQQYRFLSLHEWMLKNPHMAHP